MSACEEVLLDQRCLHYPEGIETSAGMTKSKVQKAVNAKMYDISFDSLRRVQARHAKEASQGSAAGRRQGDEGRGSSARSYGRFT
jgi:hypothetical protein